MQRPAFRLLLRRYCECHYSYKELFDGESSANIRILTTEMPGAVLDAIAVLAVAGRNLPVEGVGVQLSGHVWELDDIAPDSFSSSRRHPKCRVASSAALKKHPPSV